MQWPASTSASKEIFETWRSRAMAERMTRHIFNATPCNCVPFTQVQECGLLVQCYLDKLVGRSQPTKAAECQQEHPPVTAGDVQ